MGVATGTETEEILTPEVETATDLLTLGLCVTRENRELISILEP